MDFSYSIKPNDESIDEVVADEEFYNYEKTKLHNFDSSYEDLYQDILNDDSIVFDYFYPEYNFDKKYVLNSFNLWKELGISLHNINIFKLGINENTFKKVNRIFLNSFKEKDPSRLKLKFERIPMWKSQVHMLEVDEDIYKGIVFYKIILPKVEKKLASTTYAHELTHTQLLTRDGGTLSIHNEEMIPIFMEYVFATIQEDPKFNLRYVQNERLMSICKFLKDLSSNKSMNYFKRVELEKYIISSIQAIRLFNIYYSGSEEIKKEILSDINKLLNGEIIVEDIINKYNVSYDNKKPNLKELKLIF